MEKIKLPSFNGNYVMVDANLTSLSEYFYSTCPVLKIEEAQDIVMSSDFGKLLEIVGFYKKSHFAPIFQSMQFEYLVYVTKPHVEDSSNSEYLAEGMFSFCLIPLHDLP